MPGINTEEAARLIGVLPREVRHLIARGYLKAEKFGRDWMVDRRSAEAVAKMERKPGPKPKRRRMAS